MTDIYETPTSELDAVNLMLASIQEAPINSLDDSAADVGEDALTARNYLAAEARTLSLRGWDWNTENSYLLALDSDSKIQVPFGTLKCDIEEDDWSDRGRYTLRGRFIYDRRENTFVIEKALKATLTILLPFDQLPEAARDYIAKRAARRFQVYMRGESSLMRFEQIEIAEAMTELMRAELEADDSNALYGGDPNLQRVLSRPRYTRNT